MSASMPVHSQLDGRLFARYAIRETMGLVMMGVALFWSAGTLDWWPAWAVLTVMLVWIMGTALIMLRLNPGLIAERLGPRKGAKRWDTAIMGILGLMQLARYIVAGLDKRYGWSDGFPIASQITALAICALGYALFLWAIASNAYFSQIVRLQPERGHAVATGGPYQYVRHPSYIGAILFELAVPVLLSSWWAAIPSWLGVALLILRTALEDRTLQKELAGYEEYTREVPYRLIPGIW